MDVYSALLLGVEDSEQVLGMFRRLASVVTPSFRPPDPHRAWDAEAVDDLIGDMFAAKGPRLLAGALTSTTDQQSFESYLLTAIRNFLKDQAKATPRGRLRSRLETILPAAGFIRFDSPERSWGIKAALRSLWQGDLDELLEVAWRLRGIVVTRWNEAGPTSKETKQAIVRISGAVLEHTGRQVRDEDLARVVENRITLITPVETSSLELASDAEPPAPDAAGDARTAKDAGQVANLIWSSLTEQERAALPHLHQGDRKIGDVLGAGRHVAGAVRNSALAKIRAATDDDVRALDVLSHLLGLAGAPDMTRIEIARLPQVTAVTQGRRQA